MSDFTINNLDKYRQYIQKAENPAVFWTTFHTLDSKNNKGDNKKLWGMFVKIMFMKWINYKY